MTLLQERTMYSHDINGDQVLKVVKGKELQNLFNLVNSQGFLDGEVYDGYLVREEPNGFETFHFFFEGSEQFQIVLGSNTVKDIGALKIATGAIISEVLFVQGSANANEAIGTLIGAFFSIGGTSVVFTIIQDLNNVFELQDNNQLHNTAVLTEGAYEIIVKAVGMGGTEFINRYIITIGASALITNINLSNVTVQEGASIGTSVGGLSTVGGEPPITFELAFQGTDAETPVDIFEIDGNTLQTKAAVGLAGASYLVIIRAIDSRSELPEEQRIKVQTFTIEVVLDTFLNTTSLTFDGSTELLKAADSPSFGTKTKLSWNAWVKPTNTGSVMYIMSKFGSAGQRSIGIRINVASTIGVAYSQTGITSDTTTGVGTVNFGEWNFIGISYDGTLGTPEMNIYLGDHLGNGGWDKQDTTLFTSLFNSTVDILIGALFLSAGPDTYQNYLQAIVDEQYFYDDAFTEAQFDDIYNLGVPTNNESLGTGATMFTGLRMGDDFTGTTQPDLKGNNDFTAVNINNSNKSSDVP